MKLFSQIFSSYGLQLLCPDRVVTICLARNISPIQAANLSLSTSTILLTLLFLNKQSTDRISSGNQGEVLPVLMQACFFSCNLLLFLFFLQRPYKQAICTNFKNPTSIQQKLLFLLAFLSLFLQNILNFWNKSCTISILKSVENTNFSIHFICQISLAMYSALKTYDSSVFICSAQICPLLKIPSARYWISAAAIQNLFCNTDDSIYWTDKTSNYIKSDGNCTSGWINCTQTICGKECGLWNE